MAAVSGSGATHKVLIVDDDPGIRFTLSAFLNRRGYATAAAESGALALDMLSTEKPSAMLLDLRMPDLDGIGTLVETRKREPHLPVIIVSGRGDIQTAVDAMRYGAYDFITKPPDFDRLTATLQRALEKRDLEKRVTSLHAAVETSIESVLGRSAAMRKVIEAIHQVAFSDLSVIIQGETGTGKTTVAQLIHTLSRRAQEPFVTVDVGAIPETLVESELFGYVKGAFTGAERRKPGYFELAAGGTVLLDELQNISPLTQAKLLRAVEERRIQPLGATAPVDTDVRVISATNRDIRKAVTGGTFREDLFYRLGEFIIELPPLRERREDVPMYVQKFLAEAADSFEREVKGVEADAMDLLARYSWPGNVRELKSAIRKAVLREEHDRLTAGCLDFLARSEEEPLRQATGHSGRSARMTDERGDASQVLPLRETVRDAERRAIITALNASGGNKFKASSMLQVDYKTILKKMREYDIRTEWK
jgi:DNA-binding NtrC family response regulator